MEGIAHLANPGRLGEILLPGTELLLERRPQCHIGWRAHSARVQALPIRASSDECELAAGVARIGGELHEPRVNRCVTRTRERG